MILTPSQRLQELHQTAERRKRLERLRARHDRDIAREADYRELRWLEKDYDDERNGDWTR
jgi:hypothetical protein